MNQTKTTLNQMSAHLAWCALAALGIAKRDGRANGNMKEHLFLFEWLKQALRQKRFSKDVAPDLRWLINQGENHPTNAKLKEKLQYLYDSGTGKLTAKNDLYRLTTILGTLSQMGWPYSLLTEVEWLKMDAARLNANTDYLRIRKASLDSGFNNDGTQTDPIDVVLTGRANKVEALLASCCWSLSNNESAQKPFYHLLALPD
ncbi:DUF2913 family protein [Providencia rettgeri]|uniref:DUF2913 family protein n=1 Tax=Providencia rettgeri TaxID=587 RepID=UPI001B387B2E|nr:DUF2913 family protein [Providencia rettgeri]MBQ0326258.1 DUF2913 family protein [Providencia rettgeri]